MGETRVVLGVRHHYDCRSLLIQLGEQLQSAFDGQQSIDDALKKAQDAWVAEF